MWKKNLLLTLFCLFFSIAYSAPEEAPLKISLDNPPLISEHFIPSIGVTQLKLSNGMEVILKPTKSFDDEILLQITARGGWMAFPEKLQAAAKYSGTIALESGLGNWSRKELVDYLFKYSIELSVRTREYFRSIEASSPVDFIEQLLTVIHQYFAQPRFNQTGLDTVIANAKDAAGYRKEDCELLFEEFFFSVNSDHSSIMNTQPLSGVVLPDALAVFEKSFSSPEEFSTIIVGHFDLEKMKKLVVDYLGGIEAKTPSDGWRGESVSIPFPTGQTRKEMRCGRLTESVIRLTFPAMPPVTATDFYRLDLASQAIETRLRETLQRKFNSSLGVDVGYLFPLMPHMRPTWLSVKFRAPSAEINQILNTIFIQLGRLQERDLTKGEFAATLKLTERMNLYWQKENRYWVAMLANYVRWGWDLNTFMEDLNSSLRCDQECLNDFLMRAFPIDNYTVTIMH